MRKIFLGAAAAAGLMISASTAQYRVVVPGIGEVTTEYGVARSFDVANCRPINVIPVHEPITLPYVFFAIVRGNLGSAGSAIYEMRTTWHDGVVETDRQRYNFGPDDGRFCIQRPLYLTPRAGTRFEFFLNGALVGQTSVRP